MSELKSIPRPEYPRPQMVREKWLNLNGRWEFEIDSGASGRQRGLVEAGSLKDQILVPFCPESRLSGVEHKDFMAAVWYRREFEIPTSWAQQRILLHFGAVDYETEVWVNGVSVGRHQGGYSSFTFEITAQVKPGINTVLVCAEDDTRCGKQPRGKQSDRYESYGCAYTRTTGIWQTVWLEAVPQAYLEKVKYIPDSENNCVHLEVAVNGSYGNMKLSASILYGGKPAGEGYTFLAGGKGRMTLALTEKHLWEPGAPNLHDVRLDVLSPDGDVTDSVSGYFGLRSVALDKEAILINGKPVFQRLVLDQGFYPDGIYTAPTEEDLKRDIEISMGLGFNGARLHQKVFEPRFLYWADRMGYLVWGEQANWGLDISTPSGLEQFLPEWLEVVERDFSHPALVGWCPFNETWYTPEGTFQDNEVLRMVYRVTKLVDPTRPVIDSSGWYHVETDIYDVHDYEQDPAVFAARYEPRKEGGETYVNFPEKSAPYQGQPYFVSEYGGIWWNPGQQDEKSWGYGNRPKTGEEFVKRYEGLTMALLEHPRMCAFCYTQLYDVEQEVNGLYTYDRKPKFDPEILRKINTRKAAIER